MFMISGSCAAISLFPGGKPPQIAQLQRACVSDDLSKGMDAKRGDEDEVDAVLDLAAGPLHDAPQRVVSEAHGERQRQFAASGLVEQAVSCALIVWICSSEVWPFRQINPGTSCKDSLG